MKFSHLAALVTVLLGSFGPVEDDAITDWQEDCAGAGHLTPGVLMFGLKGSRRDVSYWQLINYVFYVGDFFHLV